MQLWDVYLVDYTTEQHKKKSKFLVVIEQPVGTYAYGFFINTDPRTALDTPEFKVCEVDILQAEHTFLSYDSYIPVSSTFVIYPQDIKKPLGRLSEQCSQKVLEAATVCPVLKEKTRKRLIFLAGLSSQG